MTELCLKFGEEQDIELEEVDIGVAEGAIAFDVSGRIVGLDETMLNQVSGKEWVPTELRVEARDPSQD